MGSTFLYGTVCIVMEVLEFLLHLHDKCHISAVALDSDLCLLNAIAYNFTFYFINEIDVSINFRC